MILFRLAPFEKHVALRPLAIEASGPTAIGQVVHVVAPSDFDSAYADSVRPGYVISNTDRNDFANHDCLTGPGTMGAPVIDLFTGRVIGIHEGGAGPTAGPGLKRAASTAAVAALLGRRKAAP